MLAKIKVWIAGAAMVVALIIGAFFSGSLNGKKAAEVRREKQAADSLRKARKIESEAASMPIDRVRARIGERLRD